MSHDRNPLNWVPICALDDIVPNTGVCALVGPNGGGVQFSDLELHEVKFARALFGVAAEGGAFALCLVEVAARLREIVHGHAPFGVDETKGFAAFAKGERVVLAVNDDEHVGERPQGFGAARRAVDGAP